MPLSLRNAQSKDSIEQRRARGEIACAECRRHKLRCNRSIPCSTCVRKGCQTICPNGTLTPGRQTRHLSVDMDVQQRKLVQMSKRIRQLEDALQISHGSVSSVPHPLLSEDLLYIKGLGEEPVQLKKESDDEDAIDSHGTLAVLGRGIESYVGTDALVIDRLSSAGALHLKVNPTVPPPFSYPSGMFPFSPLYLPAQDIQALIEENLPSFERASALIEAYLGNISWLMRTVDREQLMEELIPEIYRRRRSASNEVIPIDPHTLSLLLSVFACGAVADLTLSPWNEEADLYYRLAWTAISLKPVFDGAGLHSVQAIAILGSYDIFSCRKTSLEGTWKMISFCMSLAASIGLHRDPAHFKLSPKQVQRRRNLFWELYSLDMWKTISSGRPMTFTMSVVDCELPKDKEATLGEDDTEIPSVWQIRYRFAKEVLAEAVEKLSAARPLKYSEILRLDQKIREFGPQHVVNLAAANASASHAQDGSMNNLLKAFLLVMLKDATLILLHRNFFVRALVENPANPMRSHFAPSFLATYRSAATILRKLHENFDSCSHLLARVWPMWAHALSAIVILGSVAACGTTSALAPQAYLEFNLALEMLTKSQMHPLVKDVMPMLLRLRDQAIQALTKNSDVTQSCRHLIVNRPPAKEDEKEFNAVSGLGRLIRKGLEGPFGPNTMSRFLEETMLPESRPKTLASSQATSSESSKNLLVDYFTNRTVFSTSSEHGSRDRGLEGREDGSSSQKASQTPNAGTPTMATTRTALRNPSPESLPLSSATSLNSRGSSEDVEPGIVEPLALDGVSVMEVDTSPGRWPANTRANDEYHATPRLASSSSSTRHDAFGGIRTFPDANCETFSYDTRHGDGHAGKWVQGNAKQATPGTPLALDALSTLSPTTLFNTDFDVSHDMRVSMGDESVLPLLSEDLGAWRTILQDSRFFGIPATSSEAQGDRSER